MPECDNEKEVVVVIKDVDNDNDENDDDEVDSADEALFELLGLPSTTTLATTLPFDDEVDEKNKNHSNQEEDDYSYDSLRTFMSKIPLSTMESTIQSNGLSKDYNENGICIFPQELSIPAHIMRQLTEELVWGGDKIRADKTYETIATKKKHGEMEERRTLTRLENFVNYHSGWYELCHDYIRTCISILFGQEMVLFKEKLNLKPSGGKGFAPHLDAPSLRIAFPQQSQPQNNVVKTESNDDAENQIKIPGPPQTFVTVMIAIDDMTSKNGCLRVVKGPWSDSNACPVIQPEAGGNPDSTGRAGAISMDIAAGLDFEDVAIKGGTIAAFNGWVPHRSSVNSSYFSRRAVFLTYNPLQEGNYHERYYAKMNQLRLEWKEKIGLSNNVINDDDKMDRQALSTIPKI